MNKFDELKYEIRKQYPHINTLPIWKQVMAKINGRRSVYSIAQNTPVAVFTQSAVLVEYKGEEYILKWGDRL